MTHRIVDDPGRIGWLRICEEQLAATVIDSMDDVTKSGSISAMKRNLILPAITLLILLGAGSTAPALAREHDNGLVSVSYEDSHVLAVGNTGDC